MSTEGFLNLEEEKIYNRGVTAGYFEIYIEDVSVMDEIEQAIYIIGLEAGHQELATTAKKGNLNKHYEIFKKTYLEILKSWGEKGEIVIKKGVLDNETNQVRINTRKR